MTRRATSQRALSTPPRLLYADRAGRVREHETWLATGRAAAWLTDVEPAEWIPLPAGATLTMLPGTRAIGIDPLTGAMKPLRSGQHAVGALLPQGFTRLLLPGYAKHAAPAGAARGGDDVTLPLFGYTAAGWADGQWLVAACRTDDPAPWNPTSVADAQVQQAVADTLRRHPQNRLFAHLSHCALEYGCVTARNTFLGRYEGALPVSSTCNAGCVGCISEQPDDAPFPSPQTRLQFRPTVAELVDVMATHLAANPRGVVSFGQGCEGEPATRWPDIVQAIIQLRAMTPAGYVNINTNGGLTYGIRKIVDAGLDLMRVSIVSAVDEHYNAYYRPRGYTLRQVAQSLRYASDHGVTTSINYLVFPGVTDRVEEVEAMVDFLRDTRVQLVQMRNLNIDPEYYLARIPAQRGDLLGLRAAMDIYAAECPGLRIGSYTHAPG